MKIPGEGLALRLVEDDGSELTVIARGDSLDVYHGRQVISSFAMSPTVALRLARWLLWNYFARGTWCGLKTWWWNRKFRKNLEARRGDGV